VKKPRPGLGGRFLLRRVLLPLAAFRALTGFRLRFHSCAGVGEGRSLGLCSGYALPHGNHAFCSFVRENEHSTTTAGAYCHSVLWRPLPLLC